MPRDAAMLAKIRGGWARLLSNLWFVPGVVGLAGVALAVLMVAVSERVDDEALARFPRVFGASPDSSRALLSSIAGSIITVAGLTFSLTMVALTQASSQYTPRILRTVMRDRVTQVVLGAFVGIFAYCLVVVRTIRSVAEVRFVPSIAVALGIVLALGGMGALIVFVHHIASTLQASSIAERVARETIAAVDRLFPDAVTDDVDDAAHAAARSAPAPSAWRVVPARASGYVQAVDAAGLVRWAEARDTVVRLAHEVGDFVVEGTPMAWVGPRGGGAAPWPDEELRRGVAARVTVGTYRTVEQDAAFGVRQLVDVALKALSPGVNDTTTAVTCVDWLGAVLVRLAGRRVAPPYRATGGVPRVVAPGPTFEAMLRLAVDEIRQSAGGNVGVLARLLRMLAGVAAATPSPVRRALLAEQVTLVREQAERGVEAEQDRARLRGLADEALRVAG